MGARVASILLGIWLMAAPSALGYAGEASAKVAWILGPVATAIAGVAISGVTRAVRWANVPVGAALVVLGITIGSPSAIVIANHLACGVALAALAFVRGAIHHPFGGGWRSLRRA